MKVQRALISVSNKEGVVDFAKGLAGLGIEIISTGGTSKALIEAGIDVIPIAQVTNFPEMLNGRVKTLHPAIHGGILADRRKKEHLEQLKEAEITPIDLVAVNLYPFRETIAKEGVSIDQAIENIDIGGPTMIRSAAKNFESVAVVVNPKDYQKVLEELRQSNELGRQTRLALATEAFNHTSSYDSAIYNYLQPDEDLPKTLKLEYEKVQNLRYGENPFQKAAYYREFNATSSSLVNAKQLHGKELSFNNILDLDSAWKIAKEFNLPAVVIIKHTNPCGSAVGRNILDAYQKAYSADPVSAFGGIAGINREVDEDTAKKIISTYFEAVIAPGYSDQAIEILKTKENMRLMLISEGPGLSRLAKDIKSVDGGILYQDVDDVIDKKDEMRIVTKLHPTEMQWNDLIFGWQVCKHVKSNAIFIARDQKSVGIGAGQMSRVDSTNLAIEKASKDELAGSIIASDAFFPFRDAIDVAAKAGIKAIIQPGGSVRDEEVIEACNEHKIAMVFTGKRHFKH